MIEVICGGMYAGKSELLIHRLTRASYAKKNIVAFKPAIDNRYAEKEIASHSGIKFKCYPILKFEESVAYVNDQTQVIGIDEAQFFDNEIINFIPAFVRKGIDVYIAGLDLDFAGKPFGPMPYLLSIATHVTKVHAVCMKCGADASRSQRLSNSTEQVLVGAKDTYEARCIKCWER